MPDLQHGHNPDVLSCLANLSSDEVFTPPEVANAMLDMLPESIWSDSKATFLDPACKSGVFLREIAKRLIKGLENEFPDLQKCLDHIFQKQLFGIAITGLTALLSRRSLYCSKLANGDYAISRFENEDGNIRFERIKHRFKNGKCLYCGASQGEYDRGADMESHAYEFIHIQNIEMLFNMKFDVIIGNPPYQLSDGGAQASSAPIYDKFIIQAKKLNPHYLSMIIPARWFSGGKGLDEFRKIMLHDKHIKELHDFPITSDCFPGVNIRGGICFFIWDKNYDNNRYLTKIVTHNKTISYVMRKLQYKQSDIFIRSNMAINILEKLNIENENNFFIKYVSQRKPFGLSTDFYKTNKFYKEKITDDYLFCYGKNKQIGFVNKNEVTKNHNYIEKYKIFAPYANNIGTELNDDNLNAFLGFPNQICTESYLVIGADLNLTKEIALNLIIFLKTKFARFCLSIAKTSQHATSKTYRYVPLQDFSKPWTDAELYAKYDLTEEEIAFIESMIKPMDMDK